MPIPSHLKDIAANVREKGTWTTFSLSCKCGNNKFFVFQNYNTDEESTIMAPYNDALDDLYKGFGSTCTVDGEGKVHHWKFFTPHSKKEVFLPPEPFFFGVTVIKTKCSMCGEEYILFDNRIHGYDAKCTEEKKEETLAYKPHFKQIKGKDGLPKEIEIKIENDASLDEFKENTGLNCSKDDYIDAFSWIVIYKIDALRKKRIFEFETA